MSQQPGPHPPHGHEQWGATDPWTQPQPTVPGPQHQQGPPPGPHPQQHPHGPYPQQGPQQGPQGPSTGDRLRQTWNGEAPLGLPPTPVLVRVGQLAAPVLVLVSVLLPFDDLPLLDNVLWSLWALAAAVLQALPALGLGGSDERRWTIAAVGTGGLALYWLLVSLPTVGTSSGFLVTAATAAAVAGVLTMPGRRL